MANQEHLAILHRGVDTWNQWRANHPDIRPDLSRAYLAEADLDRANLKEVDLHGATLAGASLAGACLRRADLYGPTNLSGANLAGADVRWADLNRANLRGANLKRAHLYGANLAMADLVGADLQRAILAGATLNKADLSEVDLTEADLTGAQLIETIVEDATLVGSRIYGIAAWNLAGTPQSQLDLVVTRRGEPVVTVDDLEVAQFMYLMLHNEKLRRVLDTITSKVVLILGRFTEERKVVLDALRDRLRASNYSPIVFDFDIPQDRDITETVTLLARMARFVIADLTDPRSIPQEIQAIAPDVAVPIQPVVLASQEPWSMFGDLRRKYHWVLPPFEYQDQAHLVSVLAEVIAPAEAKRAELSPVPA